MSKSADGILDDESMRLYQRALYVEPLRYPLNPDKVPIDGIEYIHKVRLETELIFPEHRHFYESMPAFEVRESVTDEEATDKSKIPILSEWKKNEAIYFSRLANRLKQNRKVLMEKFLCKKFPPIEKEREICLYCLGSDLYQKIYMCKTDEAASHVPLLSTVLHISQENILYLLRHMTAWALVTNFNHTLCRWIYALFACLQKPVSDECEEFLESFYDICVARSKDCDKNEENQIFLLISILANYFCVKAYAIGPSLDRFVPLE